MKKIILASASPRRREVLQKLGLKFQYEASEFQEEPIPGLAPEELVKYLSRKKAQQVATLYPDALIIAADTIGVLNSKILGKPRDADDAIEMLTMLSGRTHTVITGYTILDTETGRMVTRAVKTKVTFRRLSKREILSYVRTGEPLDKAGAYAIQGLGAVLVKELRGDFYNVMGLPLSSLATSLKRFGINVL